MQFEGPVLESQDVLIFQDVLLWPTGSCGIHVNLAQRWRFSSRWNVADETRRATHQDTHTMQSQPQYNDTITCMLPTAALLRNEIPQKKFPYRRIGEGASHTQPMKP